VTISSDEPSARNMTHATGSLGAAIHALICRRASICIAAMVPSVLFYRREIFNA
jgi:hypothetical protein